MMIRRLNTYVLTLTIGISIVIPSQRQASAQHPVQLSPSSIVLPPFSPQPPVCTGCIGVAGAMVGANWNTLWSLAWPDTYSNSRSFNLEGTGYRCGAIVGIAQQPNSQFIYTLHANEPYGSSSLVSAFHINQVVTATGYTNLGPQLMLTASSGLYFQEGDIAVSPKDPWTLYGVTNDGQLFSVPLPLPLGGSKIVVTNLGLITKANVFSRFTAMAFAPDGSLHVLDAGNSSIVRLTTNTITNKPTAAVSSTFQILDLPLWSQAASMNFFGGTTPYVIMNGYLMSVDLSTKRARIVGQSNLDRGVVGVLVVPSIGASDL